MKKITIAIFIVGLIMLIPVVNAILDHGTDDFEPFSDLEITFENYLPDKSDIGNEQYTEHDYFSVSHLDTTEINIDRVDHIQIGDPFYGYVEIDFNRNWYAYVEPYEVFYTKGEFLNIRHEYFKENFTIYSTEGYDTDAGYYYIDEYFWYETFEVNIYWRNTDLRPSELDFYGKIFFNTQDYSYDSADLSETKLIGLEYDGANDTAGYSAIELGALAITDGLFGMFPRKNSNDAWSFPLVHHLLSSVGIISSMIIDRVSNIFFGPIITITSTNYWNIGNWTLDDTDPNVYGYYYYVVDNPILGFGGLRIKATVLDVNTAFYQRETKSFGFWLPNIINRNISNDEMEQYQIDTSDFTD